MSQEHWDKIEEMKNDFINGKAIALIYTTEGDVRELEGEYPEELRPFSDENCKKALLSFYTDMVMGDFVQDQLRDAVDRVLEHLEHKKEG